MKNDMRVILTKRLLKEGLLRCMGTKKLSQINITDLCRESGVNRATFYNHYDSPAMILKEIAWEYAKKLEETYRANMRIPGNTSEKAVEACCSYLFENKNELKVLLSENTEFYFRQYSFDLVSKMVSSNDNVMKSLNLDHDQYLLMAHGTASAAYAIIRIWITENIQKKPAEIVEILKMLYGNYLFQRNSIALFD